LIRALRLRIFSFRTSSFLVLWNNLLQAFTFFRIRVRLFVHQGTDFFLLVFSRVLVFWKVIHVNWTASANKSVFSSRSSSVVIIVASYLSSSSAPTLFYCWPFAAFLELDSGQVCVICFLL
jgi:hypothetical protein